MLILDTHDFAEVDLLKICEKSQLFLHHMGSGPLQSHYSPLEGKVMATLFFEPSTRTRMSFESAMIKLGGKVISMADRNTSSDAKGESFQDTIETVAQYVDVIVARTPEPMSDFDGPLYPCFRNLGCHFINAGDGPNAHPSQALLDYFTIRQYKKVMDGHNICIVGDLSSSRAVNSFIEVVGRYPCNVIYTYNNINQNKPLPNDRLPNAPVFHLDNEESFIEKLPEFDILYLNRVQRERHDPQNYPDGFVPQNFSLTEAHLSVMKPDCIVLNPGPRLEEMPRKLDKDSRIKFFEQARNGVYTRMALLEHVFDEKNIYEDR